MGYSPSRTYPSWVLSKDISASRTASDWVPSMECSPTAMNCLIGSPMCHQSCKQTCFSMGSSPWASASDRSLLLCGLSTVCSFLQAFSCYGMMSSTSYSTDICSVWSPMDFRRIACAQVSGAPSPPLLHCSWCLQDCFMFSSLPTP